MTSRIHPVQIQSVKPNATGHSVLLCMVCVVILWLVLVPICMLSLSVVHVIAVLAG